MKKKRIDFAKDVWYIISVLNAKLPMIGGMYGLKLAYQDRHGVEFNFYRLVNKQRCSFDTADKLACLFNEHISTWLSKADYERYLDC